MIKFWGDLARLLNASLRRKRGYLSALMPSGWIICTTPPEPAPLCCSVQAQGPLSQVLQLARDWTSSPVLTTSGLTYLHFPSVPIPLCCPGEAQGLFSLLSQLPQMVSGESIVPCTHNPSWQMSGGVSVPSLLPSGLTHLYLLH